MFSIARTGIWVAILPSLLVLSGRCCGQNAPATVEIGMPNSLFQGVPQFLRNAGAKPFLKLMKDATGIGGNINFEPDAMTLAGHVQTGKIQLGVFQGHEFAWAKQKYPNLVPIAVAKPMQPVQAYCIVRYNCSAKDLGDMDKKTIILPSLHRDYCDLFLMKEKQKHMQGKAFNAQITAKNSADAIFDVIDEKADCTIVDTASLHFFKTVHPGAFGNVKILCQSEIFPNACIAVKKDDLAPQVLEKFQSALLRAQDLPGGMPMLATWKLDGFVRVPDDYENQLKNVLKLYPAPPVARAAVDK